MTKSVFLLFLWMIGAVLPQAYAAKTDTIVYNLKAYGIKPSTTADCSPLMVDAINKICGKAIKKDKICLIKLEKGEYHFHPANSVSRELFISNHDQDNPKSIGILLDGVKNIIIDGNGSDLIFHGRMLPFALLNTTGCEIRNINIDFDIPHITQARILDTDTLAKTITYELAPWVEYEVRDSILVTKGEGWEMTPSAGIAFEGDTRALVYNTSDIGVGTRGIEELAPRVIKAHKWVNKRLHSGVVVAMRGWGRPTPGIFLHLGKDTKLKNVKVHYAEGMGLLAQLCENITLDHFSVCLRGENDPRYFTTQADATHFSGCKGNIVSTHGLYEGMMDDAINVHGTYLKLVDVENENTVTGQYMHPQAYGFDWGFSGDKVVFVKSTTMEMLTDTLTIEAISAVDAPLAHGAKQFRIQFDKPLPEGVSLNEAFGMENVSWTPSVVFSDNVIRNNRARGALFSTPKPVMVERNLFDHTSGTAILLCGDCNGWYETGACRNVVIRNNRFVNALTNMFQFTNAIISIYPEIPNLKGQKQYFHSGIVIENNLFETFDNPLLYAKSVDGLIFRNNIISQTFDFKPFHWNKFSIFIEHGNGCEIYDNKSEMPLSYKFDMVQNGVILRNFIGEKH